MAKEPNKAVIAMIGKARIVFTGEGAGYRTHFSEIMGLERSHLQP
jgi:hypothetical protein